MMEHRVFINYRTKDCVSAVNEISRTLAKFLGKRLVFHDYQSIDPGAEFRQAIYNALSECIVVLVVIGPRWLSMLRERQAEAPGEVDYVVEEIRLALERERNGACRVIPVLVEGASLPTATDLPPSIKDLAFRQTVSIDPRTHREADLASLRKKVAEIAKVSRRTRYAAVAALVVAMAATLMVAFKEPPADRFSNRAASPEPPASAIHAPADAEALGATGLTGNVASLHKELPAGPIGSWQADAFGRVRGDGGLWIRRGAGGELTIEGSYILDDGANHFSTGRVPRQTLPYQPRGRHATAVVTGEFHWSEGNKEANAQKAVITFLNPNNFKVETPSSERESLSTLFTFRADIGSDADASAAIVPKNAGRKRATPHAGRFEVDPTIGSDWKGSLEIRAEDSGDYVIEGAFTCRYFSEVLAVRVPSQKLNLKKEGGSSDSQFAIITGEFAWGQSGRGLARPFARSGLMSNEELESRGSLPRSSEEIESGATRPAALPQTNSVEFPKPDVQAKEARLVLNAVAVHPLELHFPGQKVVPYRFKRSQP
jgi:hypothetical protein